MISHLSEIADGYDTFLVDQWGVLHNGNTAYNSAVEVMHKLKRKGKELVILSNSSRRVITTRQSMKRMAIDPNLFNSFATSGEEVWQALYHRDDRFYANLGTKCIVFQWGKDPDFFDDLGLEIVNDIENAEFILLNGTEKHRFGEYETILHRAAELKLPLICANGDFVSITPDGELIECPGVIAKMYETLGGTVRWHGKPTAETYRLVFENISTETRVLAIGDSLYHDIGGAAKAGVDSLFIMNGIHRPKLSQCSNDQNINTLLETLYKEYKAHPTYASKQLVW